MSNDDIRKYKKQWNIIKYDISKNNTALNAYTTKQKLYKMNSLSFILAVYKRRTK